MAATAPRGARAVCLTVQGYSTVSAQDVCVIDMALQDKIPQGLEGL
jgi:hypothetical protein